MGAACPRHWLRAASPEVCSVSGHLPTAACPARKTALALRASVPTKPCPYHVAIDVDLETGRALNPSCRAGRRFETRSFTVWPASVRRWLADRHRALPEPPSLAPDCEVAAGARTPPVILSSPPGAAVTLIAGLPPDRQEVPMAANTQSANARLSWFVDGEFLGAVDAAERLSWTPSPGRHRILVTDDAGLSATRHLDVRLR